ncbi:hypothetical protein EZS27_037794 [termite gut metagenome]|uniref:Uncharacterized protein n=1 Tax=termite gut metagenome TaxID=433724 RepID=A0A5J4PPZ1_9ZZZZ
MMQIADRSDSRNPKYGKVLKDWVVELSMPTKETKQFFKDKYFKYANVVGSTCSSTGSPAFTRDYQTIFNPNATKETFKMINEINYLIDNYPNSRSISSANSFAFLSCKSNKVSLKSLKMLGILKTN